MTRKNDGKSELSTAGADSNGGTSSERAAFWAGWKAAQDAETRWGCKVENLPEAEKAASFHEWEAETRD